VLEAGGFAGEGVLERHCETSFAKRQALIVELTRLPSFGQWNCCKTRFNGLLFLVEVLVDV
jgi:hypothetical protein